MFLLHTPPPRIFKYKNRQPYSRIKVCLHTNWAVLTCLEDLLKSLLTSALTKKISLFIIKAKMYSFEGKCIFIGPKTSLCSKVTPVLVHRPPKLQITFNWLFAPSTASFSPGQPFRPSRAMVVKVSGPKVGKPTCLENHLEWRQLSYLFLGYVIPNALSSQDDKHSVCLCFLVFRSFSTPFEILPRWRSFHCSLGCLSQKSPCGRQRPSGCCKRHN